jgi:hypothetical protein
LSAFGVSRWIPQVIGVLRWRYDGESSKRKISKKEIPKKETEKK